MERGLFKIEARSGNVTCDCKTPGHATDYLAQRQQLEATTSRMQGKISSEANFEIFYRGELFFKSTELFY